MNLPGFSADASLFRTAHVYRGSSRGPGGRGAALPSAITAQASCTDSCWEQYGICAGLCLLTFNPASIAGCEFGCWIKNLICQAGCESGGGGGGPPMCCPFGRSCRCGGRCVTQPNGSIACVDGVCLAPHQECP